MPMSTSATPPDPGGYDRRVDPRAVIAAQGGASVGARVARWQTSFATRVEVAVWTAMHALGAHRWREGWETDLERGWSRYRGSRCTICDEPWEGW
jgi:hypothetical protein